LESLAYAMMKHPVQIHAFVLMSNHYHLLVQTPNSDIDLYMRFLNASISKGIRFQSGRINRIFGDRYRWSIVWDDYYYQTVIRYIYQNPISAGIVKRCEDYPFSTASYIVKDNPLPFTLSKDFLTEYKGWLQFINDPLENREIITKAVSKPLFKLPVNRKSRRLMIS